MSTRACQIKRWFLLEDDPHLKCSMYPISFRFVVLTFASLVSNGICDADLVVRDVHSTGTINNLADADALLNGAGIESESTAVMSLINLQDPDSGSPGLGNFSSGFPFPNDRVGVNDNDFVVHVTGRVFIPTAGEWTFGVNSDDGSRLRIGGSDVIVDNSRHSVQDRFGTATLTQGWHSVDLVFFERGGVAALELFAAPGTHTSFAGNGFELLGDTANGGLVTAIPEPGGIMLIVSLASSVCLRRRRVA